MKNKICSECNFERDIEEFSLKSRKGDIVLRYDPKCKVCKKAERKNNSLASQTSIPISGPEPTSYLSCTSSSKRSVSKNSLEGVFGPDNLGVNNLYANDFNEFVQILRAEFAKIKEVSHVYIKKT